MAELTIDEINIGDEHAKTVLFDKERVLEFINFTQDTASIHVNKDFSNEKGFENLVVHGFGLSTIFSRILGLELPGENTVIGSLSLDFHKPVYIGDTVNYTVTVKRIIKPLGSVTLELKALKHTGEACVQGKAVCVFVDKGDSDE